MADDAHTSADDKRREARLRRLAGTMGLSLCKSRARDPERMDFGRYRIVDGKTGCRISGTYPYAYSMTLDDVEEALDDMLTNPDPKAPQHGNTPAQGCSAAGDPKWERD
jgi:hypothetical protein